MYETLSQLRIRHRFEGYIHVKVIPGAPPDLVERIGFLADRVSVNLELPTSEERLRLLAPHKTRKRILTPMRQVQDTRAQNQQLTGTVSAHPALSSRTEYTDDYWRHTGE